MDVYGFRVRRLEGLVNDARFGDQQNRRLRPWRYSSEGLLTSGSLLTLDSPSSRFPRRNLSKAEDHSEVCLKCGHSEVLVSVAWYAALHSKFLIPGPPFGICGRWFAGGFLLRSHAGTQCLFNRCCAILLSSLVFPVVPGSNSSEGLCRCYI